MGISSEAIRYYEREGIISPDKSSSSGYRSYDAWDLHVLIRTRMYRKYNFSLDETVSALNAKTFADVSDMLDAKEEQLSAYIREQERILKQLQDDRSSLHDAEMNLGKYRVEYSPAMHFLDVERSYDIIDDHVDQYRMWIDRIPFAASGGVFEFEEGNPKGKLRFGLLVNDRNLDNIPEEALKQGEPIPSRHCITTFFISGSDRDLCLDMFQPTFEFLREHNLKIAGTPFAKMVHMYHEDGTDAYRSWYQGWVPFEGEFEYCAPLPPKYERQ